MSQPSGTTPTPHVAERRALRHLVPEDPERSRRAPDAAVRAWHEFAESLAAPVRRPCRVLVTGPDALVRPVVSVVSGLVDAVGEWDGRRPVPAPDLLIGALPWRYEAIGDVPDLPGPLIGPRPAVLPLAFTSRTVTVGPVAGAGGPCPDCVHPAFAAATVRPETPVAPALHAFAAGAAGLFVRSFTASNVNALSMSLTFDIAAPQVEHRLWSCTASCRRAA